MNWMRFLIALFENTLASLLININELVDKVLGFFGKSVESPNFLHDFAEFYSSCFDWQQQAKKSEISKKSFKGTKLKFSDF